MTAVGVSDELGLRLTRQLGDRTRFGGFVYPLLLLAVGLQTVVPEEQPALFALGCLVTLAGALWRTSAALKARSSSLQNWLASREELRVSTVLLATFWAILSGLALHAYPNGEFACFLLFCLIGWASLGASLFSPDLRLAQGFIHLNMLPAMLWSIEVYGRFTFAIVCVFAILWVAAWFVAKWTHSHLRQLVHSQICLEQQTEELRLARDLAEEAYLARNQFLSGISHEIRTPLNGILGVSELLRESSLNSEQSELVALMNQSSEQLLSLVNNLLDLSRINSGKLTLDRVEFDLRLLIDEISQPLRLTADAKGLQWSVKVRREVPASCFGDPARVKQILNNLMSNALKFTDRGGVSIEIGMADGGHIRCVVEDTGIGIESSHLGRIFEEFEQVDRSITRHFSGAGLGLAISKKLIEIMGGRIGVQSTPGQGSLFWFEIAISETRS